MSDCYRPSNNFCVTVVAFALLLLRCGGTSTRCTTSTVVEGQSTAVTCHFTENVRLYKPHVNILRYDLDGQSYVPELALKCYWLDQADPKCTTSQGFGFDGYLDESLTLTIKEARKQHVGVYLCASSTVERVDQHNCTLHVKGRKISCKTTHVEESVPTSLSCLFNSDLRRTRDAFFVRYATNGSSAYVDVARCNWLEDQREEAPFCISKLGYNVTVASSGREVIIDVPSSSMVREGDGKYYCDTVGLDKGVTVDTCQVLVQRKTTTILSTKTTSTREVTTRTTRRKTPRHFNGHQEPSDDSSSEGRSGGSMAEHFAPVMFISFVCSCVLS